VIVVISAIVISNYLIVTYHYNKAYETITIYVPNKVIPANTLIDESMIGKESVLLKSIKPGTILTKEEVIGKYTKNNHTLLSNQRISHDSLSDYSEIVVNENSDGKIFHLFDYDFTNDFTDTYDIYFRTLTTNVSGEELVVHGLLCENLRKIDFYDNEGNVVTETTGSIESGKVLLSLSEYEFNLVRIAEKLGTLTVVSNAGRIVESLYFDKDYLANYILSKSYSFTKTIESVEVYDNE